jgi:hypothetical protein
LHRCRLLCSSQLRGVSPEPAADLNDQDVNDQPVDDELDAAAANDDTDDDYDDDEPALAAHVAPEAAQPAAKRVRVTSECTPVSYFSIVMFCVQQSAQR